MLLEVNCYSAAVLYQIDKGMLLLLSVDKHQSCLSQNQDYRWIYSTVALSGEIVFLCSQQSLS